MSDLPTVTGFAHQILEPPTTVITGVVRPLPDDSDNDRWVKRLKGYVDLLTSVVRFAKEIGVWDLISSLWSRITPIDGTTRGISFLKRIQPS
jgi:hypothetical protein